MKGVRSGPNMGGTQLVGVLLGLAVCCLNAVHGRAIGSTAPSFTLLGRSDQASRHLTQRSFGTGRSRLIASPNRNSGNFAIAQSDAAITKNGDTANFFPVFGARRMMQGGYGPTTGPYEVYNFNFTYPLNDEEELISYWDKDNAVCGGAITNFFFYLYTTRSLVCEFEYSITFDAINTTWTWNYADFTEDRYPPTTVNLAEAAQNNTCAATPSPPGPFSPPVYPPYGPFSPPVYPPDWYHPSDWPYYAGGEQDSNYPSGYNSHVSSERAKFSDDALPTYPGL